MPNTLKFNQNEECTTSGNHPISVEEWEFYKCKQPVMIINENFLAGQTLFILINQT